MNNILINLSSAEHSTAIDLIEKAILATDLSLHFKYNYFLCFSLYFIKIMNILNRHVDTFLKKSYSNTLNPEKHEDKELLL